MKKYLYATICLLFALLGLVAGGIIGFMIGVSNLPPDPWAGDGIGVMFAAVVGAFWGAVIGVGLGGCLAWYMSVQQRTPTIVSGAVSQEGEVWPPAPQRQAAGAVNAPPADRPSDAE